MRPSGLIERDWLTLLEAAWLLQVREHTARRIVSHSDRLPGLLVLHRGGGARVKVAVDSVARLLRGTRARIRLAQLIKGEIVAPKPQRRDGPPAPLTTRIDPINSSATMSVMPTAERKT